MVWPSAPFHQAHAGATTTSDRIVTIAQVATTANVPRARSRAQPWPMAAAADGRSPPRVRRRGAPSAANSSRARRRAARGRP